MNAGFSSWFIRHPIATTSFFVSACFIIVQRDEP